MVVMVGWSHKLDLVLCEVSFRLWRHASALEKPHTNQYGMGAAIAIAILTKSLSDIRCLFQLVKLSE